MAHTPLSGLIAAPFTPMKPGGQLELSRIPDYYSLLRRNGVSGAFINGSTGEGPSLSLEEKKKTAEAWMQARGGHTDFRIITLVGGPCLEDAIELARHARAKGVDAVAFTAPYYYPLNSVEQLAGCLLELGAQVPDLDVYYYHIPVLNHCSVPMIELLKALDGKMPNFRGVKYTHEDFMDFLSCMRFADGRYEMLWGRDENMLSALVLGCRAAVGSTFNYAAPLYTELIAAFEAGDLARAQALQQKAIDIIRLLGAYGGIATGKAFMRAIGIPCGGFRLPVRNMDEPSYSRFLKDLESLHFFEWASK